MRYYGWTIVAISAAVLTLVVGAAIYAFGLFVLPVSDEFGLTRAEMNTGIILLNFGMALSAPFIGRLLDRTSCRLVMTLSAFIFGACFVILGLSHSIWLSAVIIAIPLAAAVGGAGTLTSTTVVARWFVSQRGRAMAIAAIGISLGSLTVVPVMGFLIGYVGWRGTLIVTGCAVGTIILLLAPFVRERPGPNDVEPGSGGTIQPAQLPPVGAQVLTTLQLFRMPAFWTITISTALAFGVQQTTIISLVPYAVASGHTAAEAASLVSVFGVMAVFGKILLAWLSDRINRMLLLAGLFALLGMTSAALLGANEALTYLLVCSGLLGLATGATTPAFLALLADKFGQASFGTANGSAVFVTTFIGAGCLRFGGEVFDRAGNYNAMFASFLVVALISTLIMIGFWATTRRITAGGVVGARDHT